MSNLTLGINYYEPNQKERRFILDEATKLFHGCEEQVISYNFEDDPTYSIPLEQRKVLKRSSVDKIGGSKKVPYVKDILNEVAKENSEYIGYVNSDIHVSSNFFGELLKDKMLKFDCYMLKRFNITSTEASNFLLCKYKHILGNPKHSGIDCFIFRKEWWLKNRDKFPDDFLVGETHWDLAYKYVVMNCENTTYYESHHIWHVYHDQTWDYKTPMALHNIRLYENLTGERVVGDGRIYVND